MNYVIICVCTQLGVSSVENLMHNFPTNDLLLITWSPPVYYSNDIPFGSPYSYQVLVTDEDGDIILDTNTPHTNIEVANVTQCDTFNVSVTALLAQYTSVDKVISNNGSKYAIIKQTLLLLLFLDYSITEYDTQPLIPSISFEVIVLLFFINF